MLTTLVRSKTRQTVLTMLSLVAITACQTTSESQQANVQVAALTPNATHTFLDERDSPLHIGDNAGSIGDIDRFRTVNPTTRYVGTEASWPFTLTAQPAGATVTVKIFSLTLPYPGGRFDCPTLLTVNGDTVADLRTLAGTPTGKPMTIDIDVPSKYLAVGTNTVGVKEDFCVGSDGAWNDSIVTSVRVALR